MSGFAMAGCAVAHRPGRGKPPRIPANDISIRLAGDCHAAGRESFVKA